MAEKQTKELTPETVDFDHLEKYTLTELAHLSDSGDSFIEIQDWEEKLDDYFQGIDISEWLAEEAKTHDASVQDMLAWLYENGVCGTVKSSEKRLEWTKKSAEQGNEASRWRLGTYYLYGTYGVEKDISKGKKILEELAESAKFLTMKVSALYELGAYYDDVEENHQKALFYLQKGADLGDPMSACKAGNIYYVLGEAEKAFNYQKMAAEKGLPVACGALAHLYDTGSGCEVDKEKAFFWAKKGAEYKDALSMYHLGVFYQNGIGTTEDPVKAFEWYLKAAKAEDGDSQNIVGIFYANGEYVKQDYVEASHWFSKAVENGNINAKFNLGLMYVNGAGVTQNEEHGLSLIQQAAEEGDEDAKSWLEENAEE